MCLYSVKGTFCIFLQENFHVKKVCALCQYCKAIEQTLSPSPFGLFIGVNIILSLKHLLEFVFVIEYFLRNYGIY